MILASLSLAEQLREAVLVTTTTEWIAVVSGVTYVILAARQHPLCWPAGIISSALYIGINFQIGLNLDALLQIYYCIVGVYGWMLWMKKNTHEKPATIITHIPISTALRLAGIGIPLLLLLGYLQERYTQSPAPYADAALTIVSFAATWMTAKKYLENWLVWIAADFCYIFLYAQRDYPLTALLYLIYTFTALAGYIAWRKQIKISNV